MLNILGIIGVGAFIWLLADIVFWSPGIVEALAKVVLYAWIFLGIVAIIGLDRVNTANGWGVVLLVCVPIQVVRVLWHRYQAAEARRLAHMYDQYEQFLAKQRQSEWRRHK